MRYNNFDKEKSGIYIIRNLINNKMYVGKSINIYNRISQHFTLLNTDSRDENIHLRNSWKKYGKNNFDYFVIEYCDPEELILQEKELFWIKQLRTLDRKHGYNLRLDSKSRCIVSEETRKRLSEATKKRMSDPKERKKISERSKQFWKNNPDILKEMSQKVSKKLTNYSIVQLTRDLEFVREYPSQKFIRDNYKKLYLPAILQVCNGKKASYKGFYWRYKKITDGEIIHLRKRRSRKLKVVMLDVNTHKILFTFNSMTEAANHIGQKGPTNISKMCKTKSFYKTKNYYFRYAKDIVQS
jgi:group I intron endonuclease